MFLLQHDQHCYPRHWTRQRSRALFAGGDGKKKTRMRKKKGAEGASASVPAAVTAAAGNEET